MALVNRDSQLAVSATQQQSTGESDRKRNVKVLDEETYVQVCTANNTIYPAKIAKILNAVLANKMSKKNLKYFNLQGKYVLKKLRKGRTNPRQTLKFNMWWCLILESCSEALTL